MLRKIINEKNELDLKNMISKLFDDLSMINDTCYKEIEILLKERWHHEHEDIVNMIYLHSLRDDRFVKPILDIALNKGVYRVFDDELESTLRKCVHALKTIDSLESNKAIEALYMTGNKNVKQVLAMYE